MLASLSVRDAGPEHGDPHHVEHSDGDQGDQARCGGRGRGQLEVGGQAEGGGGRVWRTGRMSPGRHHIHVREQTEVMEIIIIYRQIVLWIWHP